jgi:serine/threonine protein kinase
MIAQRELGPRDVLYNEVLATYGIPHRLSEFWVSVDEGFVDQGWKLHISSIPAEAVSLLSTIFPILSKYRVSFKVARSTSVLEGLNAGSLGATQVGKFVTVYPRPEQLKQLTLELTAATAQFRGPRIPSDIKISSVVYARYGSFRGRIRHDRIGNPQRILWTKDGSELNDSYSRPNHLTMGIEVPFQELLHQKNIFRPETLSNCILKRGYRLLSVLKRNAKGNTFLALDLKRQDTVRAVVIKQGRAYCMSDRFGRDVRDRLKRELSIHHELGAMKGIAAAVEYFESGEDGYLIFEHVEGKSIEEITFNRLRGRPWQLADVQSRKYLLGCYLNLLRIVSSLHKAGYIHRDLNNSNIISNQVGEVTLLDLEMAHAIADQTPVIGSGTEGFISSEQARGIQPSIRDDIYSLACVLLLLMTGIDPRRLRRSHPATMLSMLADVTGKADELSGLTSLAVDALSADRDRPRIVDFERETLLAIARLSRREIERDVSIAHPTKLMTPEFVIDAIEHLLGVMKDAAPRDENGLWLSPSIGTSEQSLNLRKFELTQSAHTGVAGVVLVLSRLSKEGYLTSELIRDLRYSCAWLLRNESTCDAAMPGLFFGRAGVAVALREAMLSGHVNNDEVLDGVIDKCLNGALDWPDLTHGAAGQGVAAVICGHHSARTCAEYLIRIQEHDGAWRMPDGVAGVSGLRFSGFAHGAAGIVYFLASLSTPNEQTGIRSAWTRGIDWLTRQAAGSHSIEWAYSDSDASHWRWWCHGSPGISLAYLKAFEFTREPQFLRMATGALSVHPVFMRYGNLGFCHGLSGLGEIYLEAFRVTQNDEWLVRASAIVESLFALIQPNARCMDWTIDNPVRATADLGGGYCGVIHFLLRYSVGPDKLSVPFLL